MWLIPSSVRNTYTLLDFGDWVDSTNDRSSPFVQLLPVTNVSAAHTDFVNVRLGGVDTTGDPQWDLLPVSQMKHSPISAKEKEEMYQEMVLSRWPEIFVGCLALVSLLLGCCIWKCCCRNRCARRKRKLAETAETADQEDFVMPMKHDDSMYVVMEEPRGRKDSHKDDRYFAQDYR
jgi:hypothetical protein